MIEWSAKPQNQELVRFATRNFRSTSIIEGQVRWTLLNMQPQESGLSQKVHEVLALNAHEIYESNVECDDFIKKNQNDLVVLTRTIPKAQVDDYKTTFQFVYEDTLDKLMNQQYDLPIRKALFQSGILGVENNSLGIFQMHELSHSEDKVSLAIVMHKGARDVLKAVLDQERYRG